MNHYRCCVAGVLLFCSCGLLSVQSDDAVTVGPSEKPVSAVPKSAQTLPRSVLDGCWETNDLLQLPGVDVKQLLREDAENKSGEKTTRLGVVQTLDTAIAPNGSKTINGAWRTLSDGTRVWQQAIAAAGAYGVRLHLTDINMPDSCDIYVYETQNPTALRGPYNKRTLNGRDAFWTGTLFAEQITVECYAPATVEPSSVRFQIQEYAFIYRDPTVIAKEGNCHNDVSCYADWASESRALAGIGSFDSRNYVWCTGCLLNDTDHSTFVDYFMTAHHCVGSQTEADDTEFYWFYKTAACNGAPPALSSLPRTDGGADYLSSASLEAGSDYAFLRLRQASPGGVTYAGWTTVAPSGSETLTGLHMPDGSYERINFGRLSGSEPNYWWIIWASGATEPGSSGSPLFNANGLVIGQLYGGQSDCSNLGGEDYYGRFDRAYPSIRRWLNPAADSLERNYLPGDYDGDNLVDLCVYYPASGEWNICFNDDGDFVRVFSVNWGWSEAQPVPGDYDGDGTTDIAVYHPDSGYWYVRPSSNVAGTNYNVFWGWREARPVPGDYDDDGITDCAVYYPETGAWIVRKSSDQQLLTRNYGYSGAMPVLGDFNGNGYDDFAVYVHENGTWGGVDPLTGAVIMELNNQPWGWSSAKPVPADYDADGKTDRAVYYQGSWYVWLSGDAQAATWIWGNGDMLPVPGQYRDRRYCENPKGTPAPRTQLGVYFPATGEWALCDKYGDQQPFFKQFGWSEALPPNL